MEPNNNRPLRYLLPVITPGIRTPQALPGNFRPNRLGRMGGRWPERTAIRKGPPNPRSCQARGSRAPTFALAGAIVAFPFGAADPRNQGLRMLPRPMFSQIFH